MARGNEHGLVKTNFRRQSYISDLYKIALLSFSTDASGIYYTRAAAIFSNVPVQVSFCRYYQKGVVGSVPAWLDFNYTASASGPWLVISAHMLTQIAASCMGFACMTADAEWRGWLEAPIVSV
jgi:hypothetical protein